MYLANSYRDLYMKPSDVRSSGEKDVDLEIQILMTDNYNNYIDLLE